MSLKTLMRNIFSFTQILQQAGTEQVSSWTEKSLQNALHWAEYCEQVYKEVKGRPYEAEFEKQLINIGLVLNPPCCLQIDLLVLKDAKTVLKQTLIRNPHLSDEQLGGILNLYNRQTDHENFEQVLGVCASEKASVTVLTELLSATCSRIEDGKGCNLKDCYLKAHAVLVMEYLSELRKHCDKQERFQTYMEKLLERISTHISGLEMILHFVVLEATGHESGVNLEEDMIEVQKLLLEWILGLFNDNLRCCELLKVERKLLCVISDSHSDFFNAYLSCLIKKGNQMVPVYHPMKQGRLYSWRNKNNHGESLDYGNLLAHIQTLLSSADGRWKFVCQKIKSVAKLTDVNVWQHIMEDCKKGR